MITIDGTVSDIRGYPLFFLIMDARRPAVSAPAKAAAGAGIDVRSTSSSLRVLAMAPISAAVAAMGVELLNMIENPNTPKKLAISLRIRYSMGSRFRSVKSSGRRLSSSAMIHANIVATRTMIIAYESLSRPDRRSSFARSIPLVINGNPGMIKSMEQMYPASCTDGTWKAISNIFRHTAYTKHDAEMDTYIFKNKVKWCFISLVLIRFPIPAAINASSISIGPPPSRNVNAQHAIAAARPSLMGE